MGALPIFALALALRLVALGSNPAWDIDEGYNLSIARHLLAGDGQMFAVRQVFVQHPPLYYALVAVASLFAPAEAQLFIARLVAAVASALAVFPLYLLVRRMAGTRAAVLAGAGYATGSLAVAYGRFAYTYSLLLPLLPLIAWLLLRVEERPSRSRFAALGGALALALLAERMALPAALVALLWLWRRMGWRAALGAGFLAALPSALYILPAALFQADIFWFDALHTGGRVGDGGALQLVRLLDRYSGFVGIDPLVPVGIAGLFALLNRRGGVRLVVLCLTTLTLALLLRDPRAYFRQALPLLPLLYLGVGVALDLGMAAAWRCSRKTLPFAALSLVLMVPAGMDAGHSAAEVAFGFSLPNSVLLAGEKEARAAAAAVNALAGKDDLVVADGHVGWLLQARVADWAQAAATSGQEAAFYPAGMGEHYFAYDARLASAHVAVVDEFIRQWAAEESNGPAATLYREVTKTWSPAGSYGQFTVYLPPQAAKQ